MKSARWPATALPKTRSPSVEPWVTPGPKKSDAGRLLVLDRVLHRLVLFGFQLLASDLPRVVPRIRLLQPPGRCGRSRRESARPYACAAPKRCATSDLLVYSRRSCLLALSICSWCGCSAGRRCWRAVMPRRTRRSWYWGTKSRKGRRHPPRYCCADQGHDGCRRPGLWLKSHRDSERPVHANGACRGQPVRHGGGRQVPEVAR